MKLNARMYVGGERIDYTYDIVHGLHQLWFASRCHLVCDYVPGVVANDLMPYRGNKDVDELISWLVR